MWSKPQFHNNKWHFSIWFSFGVGGTGSVGGGGGGAGGVFLGVYRGLTANSGSVISTQAAGGVVSGSGSVFAGATGGNNLVNSGVQNGGSNGRSGGAGAAPAILFIPLTDYLK